LKPASDKLNVELHNTQINDMSIPVITNLTGDVVADKNDVIDILTKQVMNSVRWQQSVEKMMELGVDTFVEMGPGKTLSSFVKKTAKLAGKEVAVYNVEDIKTLEKTCEALGL
jgi:[acyl-carrier-protein] S-malonyltransferase